MSSIISKRSPFSVNETMDKFEAIIKEKGLNIAARVNHKKSAENVGLEMNEAQVLIFGNPKAGTLIMQENIMAALDLPMKVVAYQNNDNEVYIAYHSPAKIEQEYNIQGNTVIEQISAALDNLTSAAIA